MLEVSDCEAALGARVQRAISESETETEAADDDDDTVRDDCEGQDQQLMQQEEQQEIDDAIINARSLEKEMDVDGQIYDDIMEVGCESARLLRELDNCNNVDVELDEERDGDDSCNETQVCFYLFYIPSNNPKQF